MTLRFSSPTLHCTQLTSHRLASTRTAPVFTTAPCRRSFIAWRGTESKHFYKGLLAYPQLLRGPMSSNKPESPTPHERRGKRRRISRRISKAFGKQISQKAVAKETNMNHPTLPQIVLTPIEQTLRLCLLDAAEFIQQRNKREPDTTPTATEPLVLRFAGGWVRDKLLGVESHDIDVAINSMTGEKFGEGLKEYLSIPGNLRKYKIFHPSNPSVVDFIKLHKIEKNPERSKHLETATTRMFGLDIDFVNLRKETYTDESRNPQVEVGTPEEDSLRRDATVNALFYNIHTELIEDFTGQGLQDMKNKIIRTPMEPFQTFKDDPLRVLRLIRFASRLGYTIDCDTEEAMKIDAIKSALKAKISQERIGVEIEKTLRGPDPLTALQRINRLGLYDTILANHQDNVGVDTSSWERGYDLLSLLLSNSAENGTGFEKSRQYVRDILIRNENERYFSWLLAALAPWTTVPDPIPSKPTEPMPRATTVAKDSLRADNKAANIITAASKYHKMISHMKSSFLKDEIADTPPEVRAKVGQFIRTIGRDWRLCFVLAIVREAMQGQEPHQLFQSYEKFLLYIENDNLLDAFSLRPLINGHDIISALGVKTGPWMGTALEMLIEWQLRNPEETSKEAAISELLRRKGEAAVRARWKSVDDTVGYHLNPSEIQPDISLGELWSEISTDESSASNTDEKKCEDLLIVEAALRAIIERPGQLQKKDQEAARFFIFWAANAILPNEDFTGAWEEAQLSDTAKLPTLARYKVARLRSTVGVSVLQLLHSISPINELEIDDSVDVITSLAAFTCRKDPWTTETAFNAASVILEGYESLLRSQNRAELAAILEEVLRKKVKPLFSKTKTPAVTAAGRKNVHPIPQPRFDPSIFDPKSKPWKFKDLYVITVLSWVIGRYSPSDKATLESQFPLLVPAILSLIDDETLAFKAKGSELLLRFLAPLEESKSDLLWRTNLDSVFQDALTPCLLSLPTLTPESESIHLLQYAYPACLAVIRTRFPSSQSQYSYPKTTQTSLKEDPESQQRLESLTRLLRQSILQSYHHTSNPAPLENTSISSYPHPRLSALLLSQLSLVSSELGIHTTKHLQDLVPVLSATLSNPFGTAYPPLLLAATEATKMLVLNAWPRIWRWRAELLAGLCACWLHVCDDLADMDMDAGGAVASITPRRGNDAGDGRRGDLIGLQGALKEVVGVLRITITECADLVFEKVAGDHEARGAGDEGMNGGAIDVDGEFRELVGGDGKLHGLLIGNENFDS
ncbi:hypothetical protein PABG_11572 [Paracoccidioides brasiliensis Pb03]|nr:hypothetical protein PABG_11572 [Paracoccidioides brasiliensis Pb03]